MDYRIIFKNQLTKKVYVFTRQDESHTPHFYRFQMFAGMEQGEYEYFVTKADGTLTIDSNDIRLSTIDGEKIPIYDRGMAQVGRIEHQIQDYNLQTEYRQYNG